MTDVHSDLSGEACAAPAADAAASLQLAETPYAVWHPSATLFADTLDAIRPAVQTFALAKNVPIDAHTIEPVAIHAVKCVSRNTMRGVLKMDADAILRIQVSISHSLDILCLGTYIARVLAANGREQSDMNVPMRLAEQMLAKTHSNDRAPRMTIWPDMETMVRDHLINAEAWDASSKTLTLSRCMIKLPVMLERARG